LTNTADALHERHAAGISAELLLLLLLLNDMVKSGLLVVVKMNMKTLVIVTCMMPMDKADV
jgi:hypothetical protein